MASEKITKFVEEIKTLTVLELNELVKAIEEGVRRIRCCSCYGCCWPRCRCC